MENTTQENTLFEQIKVEGTPFTAVRYDNEWFLALGKYRLTQKLKSKEAVEEEADKFHWDRIMQVIQIMIDEQKEINEFRNKQR